MKKISPAPNRKAKLISTGRKISMTSPPTIPPIVEATLEYSNASRGLPSCAMGKPSKAVTTAEAVPGVFSRIAEMEPPYSAPAYTPTRATRAILESME